MEYEGEENKLVIREMVGKGGFGEVFKGINYRDDSEIAIKVIKTDSCGIRDIIELTILATYDHPFLLKAECIIYEENRINLILEYGPYDLHNYCKDNEISDIFLKRWTYQISQALGCLHRENIIHGDVKPSNILLFQNNTVKLCDFSLSILGSGSNRKYRHSMGTEKYNSYEMLMSDEWDRSIDIWALGCTLYEISCSDSLVKTRLNNLHNLIDNIKNRTSENIIFDEEDFLNQKFLQRDEKFIEIVINCLKKNPEKRLNINEINNNEYFTDYGNTKYYISTSEGKYLNRREKKELKRKCENYLDDFHIIKKAIEIYSRCFEINMDEDEKIYTCLWISNRMMDCGKKIRDFYLQSYEIKRNEKIICEYLNYRLHLRDDENWL